jgi:beta-xylosidase
MKKFIFATITALAVSTLTAGAEQFPHRNFAPRYGVPLDSIMLSDPCILADEATHRYYMTGTGGLQWRSDDLQRWDGPFVVAQPDTTSWMGSHPAIWAAEMHKYNGRYYYFATFTNHNTTVGEYRGAPLERRACHLLVADSPEGPFTPVSDKNYLPADKLTLDGTFWVDTDNNPYMVYCWEWLQNWDGTIEKIRLTDDLSTTVGEGKVLFRASDSPWSREVIEGDTVPNRVTDGPWLFRTQTGRLGMLWTSWVYNVYTQGVAYSESGTLDGPWIQEPEPITPPNYGHGMLFRDFNGNLYLSAHSHREVNGHYIRIPHLFRVDDSGDRLRLLP